MLNYQEHIQFYARIEKVIGMHTVENSIKDSDLIREMRIRILLNLDIGMKVEMEHKEGEAEAIKTALDHLEEDPNYYKKLGKSGLIDEF